MKIQDFFNDLEKDIKGAKTLKSIRILSRRLKSFVSENINNNLLPSTIKNKIKKSYRKSLKLLKSQAKQLN